MASEVPRRSEVAFACVRSVRRCLPAAGVDRSRRTRRPGQGAGDSRAPPRAGDPSAAGGEADVRGEGGVRGARSGGAGGVQPDAAAPVVERLLGAAGDAPAMASPAGGSALDLPAPRSWAAAARS